MSSTHTAARNRDALAGRRREGAAPRDYQRLLEAAERLERGDTAGATALLGGFATLHVETSADDLKTFLFWRALGRRADETLRPPGNLYLHDFAFRQLDLFNLMAERLPLVRRAADAANEVLACQMLQVEDPVLVDIGVGTGRQVVSLLHRYAAMGGGRARVVAVEPSAENLRRAQASIAQAASALRLEVSFEPVVGCVEELSREQWSALASAGRGAIFNEAFALHHVAHRAGPFDRKDAVLRRVADLEPSLLVMSEPDSDHQSPRLSERFANAWRHFGLVFEAIDRIDASPQERDAIKVLFFAREIDDILSAPEAERCERHESARMWLERLRRAGLQIRRELSACEGPAEGNVRLAWKGDHLGLDVRGETVVALIAAAA